MGIFCIPLSSDTGKYLTLKLPLLSEGTHCTNDFYILLIRLNNILQTIITMVTLEIFEQKFEGK